MAYKQKKIFICCECGERKKKCMCSDKTLKLKDCKFMGKDIEKFLGVFYWYYESLFNEWFITICILFNESY